MAESGGLENRCVREGTVGSNPTPSAVVRIATFGQFIVPAHRRAATAGQWDNAIAHGALAITICETHCRVEAKNTICEDALQS